MKQSCITLFILFSFFCATYAQTPPNEEKKLTRHQKKVEQYIIEKFHCKHHISIEFHDIELFDLQKLISDHKTPKIFKDEPRAINDNKKAFNWLEEVGTEYDIPYTMTYIFGTKDEEDDEWNFMWVLLLLDFEMQIIGHIRYFP